MDDNGSRTLDREELMKGLYDYGLKFTKAEVTQIMTDIDKDRSGLISFNEFLQALRASRFLIFSARCFRRRNRRVIAVMSPVCPSSSVYLSVWDERAL